MNRLTPEQRFQIVQFYFKIMVDFHKRIFFSDEAHFWLNGYVNKQNCGIWSEANPQVYVETPLHPEKLTVWGALWTGGIIGPYFFKNDEGHNQLWSQQDGATCHTARATIDLLKYTFGDRLISRFGPVNWPPRYCDLTPLDYFLWGYLKTLVYADKPQTRDHLEDNIRRVIADIRPQMMEKVIENWTSRLDYIRVSRGSPMPEIIFKMNSYPGFSSGRPRGTTPADDRCIVLQARRNRWQTAGEIARHSTQATGRPISRFTVARRLHGGGLFARRPLQCVPLTPAHRTRCSLWCREHRNWRDNEWGRVLFTDESRFSLSSDSHRILIWREQGKPQSSLEHH
ncbi:transposase [Trichonephila clavipes]|nr:transposase [Trichonephila clavipes]